MVAGGRKDGCEKRPRPPNPGWRLYGGSLSVRILIYAGTCRALQSLFHHAWNVCWQCSNICAICAQYMQVAAGLHSIYCIVHGMFGCQCSYSTAIYASGCRACTALVQLCMEESGLWLGQYGNRSHDAVQTRSPAESAPARSSPAAKIPHSSI